MNKWLFLPAFLLLFSCHKGGPILNTRPSGVLSKSKMIDMLTDINLAESALRVGTPTRTQPEDTTYQKSMFIKVFEKNKVNPDDFDKSLTYYTEHVDDLNEIYMEVINRLTTMGANLEGKKSKKELPVKKEN